MLRFEILTMWITMALMAGSTVLYAYHFLSKRAAFSWYASFLTGAAFLCLTASVGLHSSVNAAKDMHGSLTAHSDGPGCGAIFTLELPVAPTAPSPRTPESGHRASTKCASSA